MYAYHRRPVMTVLDQSTHFLLIVPTDLMAMASLMILSYRLPIYLNLCVAFDDIDWHAVLLCQHYRWQMAVHRSNLCWNLTDLIM